MANASYCSMRGNCGGRLLRGNTALILRAGRSDWWTEMELQIRFRLQCEMEFGNLGSDDGLPGFSGWERNWVMDRMCHRSLTFGFEHHKYYG
jgi:hypothetical protein